MKTALPLSAVLAMLCVAPVDAADPFCEELWFSRNLTFDRAGFCFGSPLGQTVFDNGDCTTKSPNLSPAAAQTVAQIKQIEANYACKVPTSGTQLTFDGTNRIEQLRDIPVPDGLESACIGYTGAPLTLRRGRTADADPIGTVRADDTINWGHLSVAGWDYVTTDKGAHGWVASGAIDTDLCTAFAG